MRSIIPSSATAFLLRRVSAIPSPRAAPLPLVHQICCRPAQPTSDLSPRRLAPPNLIAYAAFYSPSSPRQMAAAVAAAAAADEGSPAKRFWIQTKKETVFAAFSPFVVLLASGKLDVAAFRHYISQDAYFLKAFANAYEAAEECADDDECRDAISALRKSILKKLNKHNPVLEEWGVDFSKELPQNPATIKYTEFLKDTAEGKVGGGKVPTKIVTPFEKTKIAAYTVGAIAPCMRLYAFLVKELQVFLQPDDSSHPYKKWIDGHSYTSFEASAAQIDELLDKLSICLTGEELEIIEKLYKQAMKLEIDFFHSQPIDQQTVAPLTRLHDPLQSRFVIFSDFDLTCSVVDSSAILAEIAILTAKKSNSDEHSRSNGWKSSEDLRSFWHGLSTQYTEEYEQCIENILLADEAKEFNYDGLCKTLEQLSDFEKRANLRVIESDVLKGLNLDDIKRAGEHLKLQDGCLEFFQKIIKKEELNADFHVLSYCWCGDLIRACLSAGGLGALKVHSNEFCCEESLSTGEFVKKMESPLDKVNAFKGILRNSNDEGKHFSVYIGDSVGDLLCLLEADVGIVVGSSVSLRRVGAHFGVSFVPLFPGLVKKQQELAEGGSQVWKGLSGVLYTVSSWAEIHAFIVGA